MPGIAAGSLSEVSCVLVCVRPFTDNSFLEATGWIDKFRGMSLDYSSIKDSDMVMPSVGIGPDETHVPYILLVNRTELQLSNWVFATSTLPSSSFSYSRMTTTSSINSSVIYLYHQVDGTTFAEDIWDSSASGWSSSNISIPAI